MKKLVEQFYPDLPSHIKNDMAQMMATQAHRESAELEIRDNVVDTLIPMTMSIISQLYESNPELRFTTGHSKTHRQVTIAMTEEDFTQIEVIVGKENAIGELEGLAMETVVKEMNKDIKKNKAKEVVTEHLVRSLQAISENPFSPKLCVNLNYDLK